MSEPVSAVSSPVPESSTTSTLSSPAEGELSFIMVARCENVKLPCRPFSLAGTIIGADAVGLRECGLNCNPVEGKLIEGVFNDDRRPSRSNAIKVKTMAAKISR
jgi:hypothetical protein